MQIAISALAVIANLIIYLAFGSVICAKRKSNVPFSIVMTVGFFGYYALFALCCLPIMLLYRPLDLLVRVWVTVVVIMLILAVVLCARKYVSYGKFLLNCTKKYPIVVAAAAAFVLIQVLIVTFSYNFTLDAAYYVANVATCVDSNMINVYNPFTGAWQDHFELRYAFATYSINDAVICKITGIPALWQTKTIMSATVVIMSNILLAGMARYLSKGNKKMFAAIMCAMLFVNLTFITLYTPANFLYTRSYEGKAIVGNVAIIAIFYMYMLMVRDGGFDRFWFLMFVMCFGTTTASSTANMLLPAALSVCFVPYIIRHKTLKMIPKYVLCMLPGLVMILVYVLYVKGYYAIYTYPIY